RGLVLAGAALLLLEARAALEGHGIARIDGEAVLLVDAVENVLDVALHALRRDAVLEIEFFLLLATAPGLGHRPFHRAGDLVGIKNDLAVDIARGAPDGLHEAGLASQEAFLVGVEDGDEAAFGNVEAFAQ